MMSSLVQSDTCMEIATYPEKFSDDIVVEINADAEDHCIIVLSNQLGRILRMMGVNVNQGKNQIHVDKVRYPGSGHLSAQRKKQAIKHLI